MNGKIRCGIIGYVFLGVGDFEWPILKDLRRENLQGYALKGKQFSKLSTRTLKTIIVFEAKENVPPYEVETNLSPQKSRSERIFRSGIALSVLFEVRSVVWDPESAVAVEQLAELKRRGFNPKTVGTRKGCHAKEFVTGVREEGAVPHPARKDRQNTLHILLTAAHAMSQKIRKRIEESFGWSKATGCFRKSRYRGAKLTHAQGQYVVAIWNLVRMAKLMAVSAPPGLARVTPAGHAVCPLTAE